MVDFLESHHRPSDAHYRSVGIDFSSDALMLLLTEKAHDQSRS